MKFSEAPQSMSADTGVSERRGMETIVMNDDRESDKMVACRCATPSDEGTSVMRGSSGVALVPPEIVNVAWAMGLHDVDVVVVLLEVVGVMAGVTGVHGGLWWLGQLSTAWSLCTQ
jgi:hypothetical protein